jgi:hypothetical protein
MGFLDWFLGLVSKPVVPAPVTPIPAPIPAPTEPLPALPVAGAPVIKIENYSRSMRRWMVMPVPFASSSEVWASKLGCVFFKVRVTVLEGSLTVTGTYCNGPHSPTITKFSRNQVFAVGESFIVECYIAPSTVKTKEANAQVNFGLHTLDLGQIIQLTALVMYP